MWHYYLFNTCHVFVALYIQSKSTITRILKIIKYTCRLHMVLLESQPGWILQKCPASSTTSIAKKRDKEATCLLSLVVAFFRPNSIPAFFGAGRAHGKWMGSCTGPGSRCRILNVDFASSWRWTVGIWVNHD